VRLREEEVKMPVAINTYVATPELIAMRYHIVGGCFAEEDNAYKLVDELRAKGYPAYILDKRKGLHRVTFGNFEKRDVALESLKKIKAEEMDGAWLLVK
jgi:cell division septation protein DedD